MKTFIIIFYCIISISNLSFAQWTEQTSGINDIRSVSAVNDYVVWACGTGGKVILTVNSGTNWSLTNFPNPSIDLYTIQGIDSMTALAGGIDATRTYVFKTVNGGANWTQTFMQTGGFVNTVVKFNGFPVCGLQGDPVDGRWTQFISLDFGSSWDSTGFYKSAGISEAGFNNSFFPGDPSFFSYFGTNKTKLVQVFADGTFIDRPTPGLMNSYSIWGNTNDRIMTGGNQLLFSTNGGSSWINVNAIGSGNIYGICGSKNSWYYIRGNSIYKSTNDGTNWSNEHTASNLYSHLSLSPLGLYMWAATYSGGISRYQFDEPLPVELSSFISTVTGSSVALNWSTSREINNSGFEIERRDVRSEKQDVWKNIGFVNGKGNTTENSFYQFTDKGLNQGKYNYRLKQIDFNGNFEYHNLSDEVIVGSPAKFSLSQNYPNPFNPSTKINYDLPFDANVNLKVFDITGREVVTLVNEFKNAGYYTADFNASSLSTGVYLYRMSADAKGQSFSSEKRMVLVK